VVGAMPRAPLGELTVLPQAPWLDVGRRNMEGERETTKGDTEGKKGRQGRGKKGRREMKWNLDWSLRHWF